MTKPPPQDAVNTPRADPLKLKMLVEHLRQRSYTYEELAGLEGLELSRRSLQCYLDIHLPAAGFEPLRTRTAGPRPRACFSLPPSNDPTGDTGGAVNRAAFALAQGVLAELFPLEGTDIDRRVGSPRVLALASGVPCFDPKHKHTLIRWINAAERERPTPVMLRYRAARGEHAAAAEREEAVRERLVWPLGVILRDGRRVYLPALVEPAASMADRRMFALERVVVGPKDCGVFKVNGPTPPPPEFLLKERPRLRDLVQPQFGLVRPDAPEETAQLHVRFDARQAFYVRDRRWYPRQREAVTPDGGLELRFGPVELREAVAWCSQWIDGVTVLGDPRLREAYERSLEARLGAQRAASR